MTSIKVVTQETLRQAVEDAQSGLDLDTTHEQYTRALFNALPTPPLAGYTRIDPEAQAVAEIMALERAGKIQWAKNDDWHPSTKWRARLGNDEVGDWSGVETAPTAVELLTVVNAALGVEA